MGELEGLDTAEPLHMRLERHGFDRLIMLSDGVFAIAVTLAALEVRPGAAWRDLPSLWAALRFPVYSYLVSFAVIATYWISHRDTFARLKRVDSVMTALTLALLFVVALLPSTTRLLYEPGAPAGPAIQLYGLNLAATGAVQALAWAWAGFRPGLMLPEVPRRYRIGRVGLAVVVSAFFAAVALTAGRGLNSQRSFLALAAGAAAVALGRRAVMRRLLRPAPAPRPREGA